MGIINFLLELVRKEFSTYVVCLQTFLQIIYTTLKVFVCSIPISFCFNFYKWLIKINCLREDSKNILISSYSLDHWIYRLVNISYRCRMWPVKIRNQLFKTRMKNVTQCYELFSVSHGSSAKDNNNIIFYNSVIKIWQSSRELKLPNKWKEFNSAKSNLMIRNYQNSAYFTVYICCLQDNKQ